MTLASTANRRNIHLIDLPGRHPVDEHTMAVPVNHIQIVPLIERSSIRHRMEILKGCIWQRLAQWVRVHYWKTPTGVAIETNHHFPSGVKSRFEGHTHKILWISTARSSKTISRTKHTRSWNGKLRCCRLCWDYRRVPLQQTMIPADLQSVIGNVQIAPRIQSYCTRSAESVRTRRA